VISARLRHLSDNINRCIPIFPDEFKESIPGVFLSGDVGFNRLRKTARRGPAFL